MLLWHNSTAQKICGVLRFWLARLYYGAKLKIHRLSMIGPSNKLVILDDGQIRADGRIILSDHVMLYAKGILQIGERLNVNSYSRIVVHERIDIGNDVTIGQMVSILDHDHHYEITNGKMELDGYTTKPIEIGNNVWIGDKCTILKGAKVGDNVIIGANSVVTGHIPSNVIVGGTPAKIIKELYAGH